MPWEKENYIRYQANVKYMDKKSLGEGWSGFMQVCGSACLVYGCSQTPEEGNESSWSWSYRWLWATWQGFWELNLGLLEDQQVFAQNCWGICPYPSLWWTSNRWCHAIQNDISACIQNDTSACMQNHTSDVYKMILQYVCKMTRQHVVVRRSALVSVTVDNWKMNLLRMSLLVEGILDPACEVCFNLL